MSTTTTGIQWTDRTWNAVRGCSRISEGCRNCYAERVATRFGTKDGPFSGYATMTKSGPRWTGKVELIESQLLEPLKWRKPQRVFVNSMSDLFHESLPDEAIDRVFAVMALCPHLTFQVLTKRAKRMREYFSSISRLKEIDAQVCEISAYLGDQQDWDNALPMPNVHLGVSVEDQKAADERIPELLRTPAAIRFVSYEPALGPVDFHEYAWEGIEPTGKFRTYRGKREMEFDARGRKLHWVIVGGESGPGARPFNVDWARNTIRQCKAAGVAVFYKQGGYSNRCAHDKKGGHFECFPEDLKIREFPDAL